MTDSPLAQQRFWFGVTTMTMTVAFIVWFVSPGIPFALWWGPTASAADIAAGRQLFEHEWTPHDVLAQGDGLGPVFNAKSCVACHFQGGVGGGGALAHNAMAFEVLPRFEDARLLSGTVHAFSVRREDRESTSKLRQLFPVHRFPPPPPGSCNAQRPDFDPVRTESVQPTALFGAGWIDYISSKAIFYNQHKRTVGGIAKEIRGDFSDGPMGRVRILPDGRIGRFGWKAQFATLEEFVAAACANELGLGTPTTQQATPLGRATVGDPTPDLDARQFEQLVAFVKTLPKPIEALAADASQQAIRDRGKVVFSEIGCAVCHVPDLGGLNGVYSDFLLHILQDPLPSGGFDYGPQPLPEHPRPDDVPAPEEWKTPPLWGVADSAPYFHDGASKTLEDAIRRHRGEGRLSSEAFARQDAEDRQALLLFLGSLRAPPEAIPLTNPAVTRLTGVTAVR